MLFRRWAIALIITLGTIVGLGLLKFQQVQAAIAFGESFPEPSAAVQTMTTNTESFSSSYKVTGQARALQVIDLHNQLPGTIINVNFSAGDIVSAGQLLLSLDTSAELAQLNSAKASYTLAKSTLARNKKMLVGNKVSQQVVDSSLADYQIALANIANIESIISKKQVRAPFSGRVGIDTFEVGQFLSENSLITTLIGDNDKIWVDLKLSQTRERLLINSQVFIQQINKKKSNPKISATVIAKQTQMNSGTRHMAYRVVLDNSNQAISHNELVNVYITDSPKTVVMVPNLAITRSDQGDFVYRLVQDEQSMVRADKLPVELGPRFGDKQVILSGLESNVLIATIGAFKLSQGLLVYPKPSNVEQSDRTRPVANQQQENL